MVPALLPIKESVRALILEAASGLQPFLGEINARWRQRMFEEYQFEGRAMVALERLHLGVGFSLFSHSDFATFTENLTYFGKRLAKLNVNTRAVYRSLEHYSDVAEPYLKRVFGPRHLEMLAAFDSLNAAVFVIISGEYYDAQKTASDTLLRVLDAELSAMNTSALLSRVLDLSTAAFRAAVGVVMLRRSDAQALDIVAHKGFAEDFDDKMEIPVGRGFSGTIAATGEAAVLADVSMSNGLLNPSLAERAKSLWGVPLKVNDQVIGVLIIGFEKPYTWLPSEKELLQAVADRSALALDRARVTDALREREARIAELSGHLLQAQEDERKRISRELHDETGQALMVIRLYLGMLDGTVENAATKAKIVELFDVVDRTIEGIRRIIARLSPLVLQELGLVAAIRKEAKDLTRNAGVHARVAMSDDVGRLSPDVEAAIYRVVQESLHNVAKYAQAKSATIQVVRRDGELRVTIEDDGVGIKSTTNPQRRSFGLAGMRERIAALNGTMTVTSRQGQGTRIAVVVPVSADVTPQPRRVRSIGSTSPRNNVSSSAAKASGSRSKSRSATEITGS